MHAPARLLRLALEAHQQVEAAPRVVAAVEHVAGLDEVRLAAGPAAVLVHDARASCRIAAKRSYAPCTSPTATTRGAPLDVAGAAAAAARGRSGKASRRAAARPRDEAQRLTAASATGRRPPRPARARAARGARRSCRAASGGRGRSPSLSTHGRTCFMSAGLVERLQPREELAGRSASPPSRTASGRSRTRASGRSGSGSTRRRSSRLPCVAVDVRDQVVEHALAADLLRPLDGPRAARLVDVLQRAGSPRPTAGPRRGRSRRAARRSAGTMSRPSRRSSS